MESCKVCGAMMENFEGYDSEYTGSEHLEFVRAYCPNCKKYYRWIEIFRFDSIAEFEEDN